MTRRIFVAQPIDDDGLRRMRELLGPDWSVDVRPPFGPGDTERSRELRGVEVLFADHCPVDGAPPSTLRWMQLGSSGYMQLRPLRLPDAGVSVTNASGVFSQSIAEWTLLMLLAFERDLVGLLRQQQERVWRRDAHFQSELWGRRVGVVGSGGSGQAVAALAQQVGADVRMLARQPGRVRDRYRPGAPAPPVAGWQMFTLGQRAQFFQGLDYLVLALALNQETERFVTVCDLERLRPGAVLINPARGQLVDRRALTEALHSGRLRGAALDAHYHEPLTPADEEWGLPNTIVTPHISASSGGPRFVALIWDLFCQNLERYLAGRPLLNVVPATDLAS